MTENEFLELVEELRSNLEFEIEQLAGQLRCPTPAGVDFMITDTEVIFDVEFAGYHTQVSHRRSLIDVMSWDSLEHRKSHLNLYSYIQVVTVLMGALEQSLKSNHAA